VKSLPGILLRAAFLLLLAALLAAGFGLARFASWRGDRLAELAGAAEIYQTSSGPQQAAIRGDGEPVLVLHGAPGGYDQSLDIAAGLEEAGFRVIAPSRPGFLGTPLGHAILPEQQAAAAADLLDTLGIPRAHVIGFSTGAPAAIHLAAVRPDKVRSLVLISGILSRWSPEPGGEPRPLPELILSAIGGDLGSLLVLRRAAEDPARLAKEAMALLTTPGEAVAAAAFVETNPEQTERLAGFAGSAAPLSPRERGTRNDCLQIRNLPALPLEKITCPTLVVNGTADPFARATETRAAAAKIPGAVFLPVEKSGHLIWLGPDAQRAESAIGAFLKSHGG